MTTPELKSVVSVETPQLRWRRGKLQQKYKVETSIAGDLHVFYEWRDVPGDDGRDQDTGKPSGQNGSRPRDAVIMRGELYRAGEKLTIDQPSAPQGMSSTTFLWGIINSFYKSEVGVIAEAGENEHGAFVMFSDGTLFCANVHAPLDPFPAAFKGVFEYVGSRHLVKGRWF